MTIYRACGVKCVTLINDLVKWKSSAKSNLKHIYVEKIFNKNVQKAKRNYWIELQEKLIDEAKHKHVELWKTIGRIGVRDNRESSIPFAVEDENGY